MKNLILKTASVIFILITMLSCENGPCIRGNNDVQTNLRNIGAYNQIKTMGSFDVNCWNDPSYDIEVTGESNILPYVSTEIFDNELQIKNFPNTCLRENTTILLNTYCPELEGVIISGSGDVNLDTFTGKNIEMKIIGSGSFYGTLYYDEIYCDISGSGDVEIIGETDFGQYDIDGSGRIYADHCKHRSATIDISGSGDVYIYCTHNLTVKISGSGNVYYTGYPNISSNISGSGSIINYN